MVYAVATKSCVYLYDTQQKIPFGVISNIHYTRLTDLTWSYDGRILLVSSTDGFCSIIIFNENELGQIYKEDEPMEIGDDEVKTPIKNINKPVVVDENLNKSMNKLDSEGSNEKSNVEEKKVEVNSTGLIIPPIISSDEKFESPEKKELPATPIAIRRYPRKSPTAEDSPVVSNKTPQQVKPTSAKKATPIAVRRKPRQIIEKHPSAPPQVEEAIDAWPISSSQENKPATPNVSKEIPKPLTTPEIDTETNMRLVYDDDDDEVMHDEKSDNHTNVPPIEPVTPIANRTTDVNSGSGTPKTPRRVDFKTISTPKSKKKIL